MNVFFSTMLMVVLLPVVPAAYAKARIPDVGERCALTRAAVLTSKRTGTGKKTPVAAGATLEVAAVEGGMLVVTAGEARGYISTSGYASYCKVVAQQASSAPASTVVATPTSAEAVKDAPVASATAPVAFGDTTKTKVAVMDLRGTSDLPNEVISSLTATVAETLDGLGAFKAISTQEIQQLLSYQATKQMLGCDDVSCIAEIGGALGADYLVTGGITLVGDLYVTQLQLTRIADTRVESRVSRDFRGNKQGLFDEVRTASKMLVRELLDQRSGELHVVVSEEGATIKIDGSIVGSSPLGATQVPGGVHTLIVEKQGFVVATQDFETDPAKAVGINVTLVPSAEFVREYRAAALRTRTIAWGAMGGGALASIGAVVLYALAGRAAADLDQRIAAYNDGPDRSTAQYERLGDRQKRLAALDVGTLVSGGMGVAALGAGALMLVLGDAPDRYDNLRRDDITGAPLGVVRLPGGWGLSLGARF
ncbi:MAG: PEGA domain-containing protein [Myxococcota bacterium]